MRLSKASRIWRLNIGRLASTGRKKVTYMLFVLARYGACGWGPRTFGTNFGSAKCCTSTHQERWQAWLSELSDRYSQIKARCCPFNKSCRILWNNVEHDISEWSFELFFLAMPDRRQTRNDQILLHVFAAATSRQGLLSFWWRVLCKYSVRLISFHMVIY